MDFSNYGSDVPSWMRRQVDTRADNQFLGSVIAGKRMAQEDAMFPLRLQAAQDQNVLNQLEIAGRLEAARMQQNIKSGMLKYGQILNEITHLPGGWGNPEAEIKLAALVEQHPYLKKDLIEPTRELLQVARDARDNLNMQQGTTKLEMYLSRQFQAGIAGEPDTMAGVNRILAEHPKLALSPRIQGLLAQVRAAQLEREKDAKLEEEQDFKAQVVGMQEAARTQRTDIASDQRHDTAIEVEQLRNLRRTDASGKVLTEGEFVNRHLGGLMRLQGVDEKVATQRLQEVYREKGLGGPASQEPKPSPSATGKVRVKSPDGRNGSIPASQLQDALNQGFTRLE